jgi:thiosulfate dehydrogenase
MNQKHQPKKTIFTTSVTLMIFITVTALFLTREGHGQKTVIRPFIIPDISSVPKDKQGESLLRGKDYLEHTFERLPQFVGAKLNCTSCHLNAGTTRFAGPWVGVVARFPQYRSRSGKVDTLTDRVNDCFERSLNGKRLPEKSPEMTDIIRYMTWLSKGYTTGQDVEGSGMPKLVLNRSPDLKKGRVVYEAKCASCHQSNGKGIYASTGQAVFPALWGNQSFNIGAGMARLQTAAGFVKKNMPLGQGNTLSDDDAWDVAAYFTQQSRPDFKKKVKDWPKGDKPKDARY